jgi:hypothetical protein
LGDVSFSPLRQLGEVLEEETIDNNTPIYRMKPQNLDSSKISKKALEAA